MSKFNAEELIKECGQLEAEAAGMLPYWRDAAELCLPLRANSFQGTTTANYAPPTKLQTDVAVDALNVLASGMLSWVTPSQRGWFTWEPSDGAPTGPLAEWLADCTLRATKILANSNFYHALHLAYMDVGAFGTTAIYAEAGESRPLNFRCWHTGTFFCSENHEGQVDRIFRKLQLTADQATQRFGDGAPEHVRMSIAANKRHEKAEYIHAVLPDNGPFASLYICPKERRILLTGEYDSQPALVTRWNKYRDDSPWGVSPAMQSLADIRGSNYMEGLLASMANLKVNPRVIKNVNQVGQVILKGGGVTQVQSMAEAPKVWAEPGDYAVGMDLLNRIDERIRRAFHVPLFEQFANIDDRVTATLVRAKQAEQLSRIAPAITLQNTDLINPLMERVFLLLFKGGHFAQPPQEAFAQDQAGQWRLLFPRVAQINRMAMAVQEMQEYGLNTLFDTFMPVMQLRPDIMDNFNADAAFRGTAKGKGLPKEFLVSEEDVSSLRQSRQEAAQAQQLMEIASKNPEAAAQIA